MKTFLPITITKLFLGTATLLLLSYFKAPYQLVFITGAAFAIITRKF